MCLGLLLTDFVVVVLSYVSDIEFLVVIVCMYPFDASFPTCSVFIRKEVRNLSTFSSFPSQSMIHP